MALIFGDKSTTDLYAGDQRSDAWCKFSKILIGEDEIEKVEDYIDVIVCSISDNGKKLCERFCSYCSNMLEK